MTALTNRRSTMTLYSDALDSYSHQVRLVIKEKGITTDVITVEPYDDKQELLFELNPYATLPTLIDRDLTLYESRIILEYLDERFPHPPLMPVYPIARAKTRRMMYRIDRDWYSKMKKILSGGDSEEAQIARKELRDMLIALTPVFGKSPYFLSEEFSLIDCCIAPLLWRLPKLGIELPAKCKALHTYTNRIFSREAFQASLSDVEHELKAVAV